MSLEGINPMRLQSMFTLSIDTEDMMLFKVLWNKMYMLTESKTYLPVYKKVIGRVVESNDEFISIIVSSPFIKYDLLFEHIRMNLFKIKSFDAFKMLEYRNEHEYQKVLDEWKALHSKSKKGSRRNRRA